MKITWIGHSCFKIEKNGYSIIIDPYGDDTVPGLKPIREKANAVFCSHGHADHYGVECVQIINGTEDSPFSVKKMNTYHDDKYGQLRGKNQIIVIEDEKSKIVHLGDLGCELLPEQKEQLMNIEVLMIPVGGYYTIDGKQAAKIVQELNPKIVIPMHYRDDTKRYGFDVISTVDDFTEQIGDVINLPTSQLDSTIDYGAQVVLLQPLNAMVS